MKVIKCLVEDINEELEGAEHYKMVDTAARIKTMLSMYRGA